MSLRIAIAGIAHETNTYSPAATSVEDFEVHRGEEISDHFTGTSTTVGGMLAAAEQLGAVTVRLLAAQATPSGTIAAEAYDALSEEILAGIEAALPLDLVALDLHGAGVVGGIDDLEGDLCRRVRAVVPPETSVDATFDLHGNLTQAMADELSLALGYHEYPHVDIFDRGVESVRLGARIVREHLHPCVHVEKLPLLLAAGPRTCTLDGGPAAKVNELCQRLEQHPGILDCTFLHGFVPADVPRCGAPAKRRSILRQLSVACSELCNVSLPACYKLSGMNERALRPRSSSSAKSLLLTILGEFALPHESALWTSTVVRSLGALGIDERNARQAIARLADLGIVRSEKEGRKARWHLTDAGHRLLVDGTKRIYEFGSGGDVWDGRWLIVLCSVPEDQRAKRHQLRTQLEFAGFGFVANGVAICPHLDREGLANAVLERLGLMAPAAVFRAEAGVRVAPADLLAKAWDLDALASAYDGFLAAFGARAPGTDEERFVDLVELVHAWRRFPFIDPEIPARLLPRHWPGHRAKQHFDALHDCWTGGANHWYETVEREG